MLPTNRGRVQWGKVGKGAEGSEVLKVACEVGHVFLNVKVIFVFDNGCKDVEIRTECRHILNIYI